MCNCFSKNLGLGAGAPPIGIPFFWPSTAMPNAVMDEWADMVFLKFNGATFSGATYPKLALVCPSLKLPDARGEFLRIWDDGRGVDSGRNLLSMQSDAIQNIVGTFGRTQLFKDTAYSGPFREGDWILSEGLTPSVGSVGYGANNWSFDASRSVRTATETRPRNITFNFLVRAK
ncbi:phage tail protein [Salmonella enterica subsp. enterica serovar Offa]|nr:phage tail protein [Salmonella enterica subsp. enterica serovar Offa]